MCPGYAARMPLVVEVGQAYQTYEKGALDILYPLGCPNVLLEGVLTLASAINKHSAQQMADAKRRS